MTIDINSITENFGKYIVQPANLFGLGGFVFDVEGEATVRLQSDITDHYTESNSAIQDHIAIRPKTVTLKNYVGELVFRLDNSTDTPLQKAVQKLTVLNSYLPALSKATAQAKKIFESGLSKTTLNNLTSISINDVADLWGVVKNLTPPTTRQAQAYMFFKALQEQKILVSLQTPFEFMTNMAIESVIPYQGESTKDMSDFTITLKEMRFAQTKTTTFDEKNYQSRTRTQSAPVTSGGKVNGIPTALDPSPIPPPVGLPQQLDINNLPVINVAPSAAKALSAESVAKTGLIPSVKLPIVPGIN